MLFTPMSFFPDNHENTHTVERQNAVIIQVKQAVRIGTTEL
jgi:hypothetical protein